jgi:hypothetical protein
MKIPEGYLPRKGDKLSFVGTLKYDAEPGDDYLHLTLPGKYSEVSIHFPSDEIEIVAFSLRIGDPVAIVDGPVVGEVVSILGDWAWVNTADGPSTYAVKCLMPAPRPLETTKPATSPAPLPAPDHLNGDEEPVF